MAKPMLVTLPFVLLLLDFWPLKRFEQKSVQHIRTEPNKSAPAEKRKAKSVKKQSAKGTVKEEQITAKEKQPTAPGYQWALMRPLLWEKPPCLP